MSNQLRPLLRLWPTVLAPHFIQRSMERGFREEWLSILWDGNWRPDVKYEDRFIVDGEVVAGDWWRLVVALSEELNVVVLLTVYRIATVQVVA